VANLERLCAIGVPTIVGTTGWYGELERVRGFVDQSSVGVVWSPNYSIGVNVFRRVVAETARLLASQPEYGAWAWEVHHTAKKDAPSGTLLQLIEEMQRAGYTRRIDASSNRAVRIRERTKSDSIRRLTPSRCGTRRAAARDSRAGR